MRGRTPRAGFTLIEVLAVMLIMSLLFTVMLNFFMDMSRSAQRAERLTRDLRRSTALLDRVAHDLETAVLARTAPEQDPLENPYVFIADARYSETGADRVMFVSHHAVLPPGEGPVADQALVSYVLVPSEEEDMEEAYDLLRSSLPGLPEFAQREFPFDEDPSMHLLSSGIASFGIRFMDEAGTWTDRWDSTQLVESSELPLAAEITVALVPGSGEVEAAEPLVRRVLLPMRPLDLAALLAPESAEEEEDFDDTDGDGEDGDFTVGRCVDIQGTCAQPGLPEVAQGYCSDPSLPSLPFSAVPDEIVPFLIVNPECQ